jgi:tetratricopeptide (TPR) repeat protein
MWSRNLGMIDQQLGQFERAEPLFKRAVALAEHSAPDWVPHELLNQAAFYRAWGRLDAAAVCANRALAIREKNLSAAPNNVDAKLDLAVTLDELGLIDLSAGHLAPAEAECRRSLALIESFMSQDQPDLAPRLAGLATVLQARGVFPEAASLFKRALVITEKNLGSDNLETAALLTRYAKLLDEMKRPLEAGAAQARAEAIRKRVAAL